MEIVRIEKINLVDAVYSQLRDLLVSGQWAEGTKLPSENELCRQFSVSRVVVREALQKLRSERLVVTKQGIGTFAANPYNFDEGGNSFSLTEETYRHFMDFRKAVEFSAARLSVNCAGEEDYLRIDNALAEMRKAAEAGDTAGYNLADFNFHLAVVQCAHNEFLTNAMLANQPLMVMVFDQLNTIRGGKEFGIASHEEMCRQMRAKNIDALEKRYIADEGYNMVRIAAFQGTA